MQNKKYFTAEEANSHVAERTLIIDRIKILKREIDSKNEELRPTAQRANNNGGSRNGPDCLSKLTKFNSCMRSRSDKGCLLKDIDMGLVDFPSIRDGREIYLCWKLGEDRVMHWHELDVGFNGRKPLWLNKILIRYGRSP